MFFFLNVFVFILNCILIHTKGSIKIKPAVVLVSNFTNLCVDPDYNQDVFGERLVIGLLPTHIKNFIKTSPLVFALHPQVRFWIVDIG